jgi:hypothetical protein
VSAATAAPAAWIDVAMSYALVPYLFLRLAAGIAARRRLVCRMRLGGRTVRIYRKRERGHL